MKCITSWTLPQATVPAVIARFLDLGVTPPAGIKLIGRWHGMSGTGFAVHETTDAKALYRWYAQWADIMNIVNTPCVDDAEAGEVLMSMKS